MILFFIYIDGIMLLLSQIIDQSYQWNNPYWIKWVENYGANSEILLRCVVIYL